MEKRKGETMNLQLIESQKDPNIANQLPQSASIKPETNISSRDSEEYDPHKHRDQANSTTNMETFVHILKGSLGTGILAMPDAFSKSGIVTGVIATVLIGILCTYCLHLLVNTQYQICKRLKVPVISYPLTMKYALENGPSSLRWLAPAAPIIVDVFLITYQMGICCVYIVFIATNIKQVADEIYPSMMIDLKYHMLILLIPLILINYIRNLKVLAPFSTLANIITFVGLTMVLVYVFDNLPSINERQLVGSLKNFSLYFGTTLFALEAVGVVIALENKMKTPKNFGGTCGILNSGMSVIVVMYILVGLFGYIKYGDGAKGSITLNLPPNKIMAQSIKLLFAFAIFITYALQSYVPVEIIWTSYMEKYFTKHKLLWEYVCRTLVTLTTFILAISVPRLALFISLFGALCLSALGIAFPAIIELCTYWPNQLGKCKRILIKDIFLIIFGIIGLIIGTYVSLVEIINSFKD